jgi:hypothetical protein
VDSLHDHLLWQLNLTRLSPIQDRIIALTIIDATDDSGRLTTATSRKLQELFPAEDMEIEHRGGSRPCCTPCSSSSPPVCSPATCRNACCCSWHAAAGRYTPWTWSRRVILIQPLHCTQLSER